MKRFSLSALLLLCLLITGLAQYPQLAVMMGTASGPIGGPLDDVSADAYAAYSVARSLDKDWTNAIIRIRESGGNNETNIGVYLSGRYLVLDASGVASWCGANAGYVVTLYDQSGNANDATQATSTKQMLLWDGGDFITLSNGKIAIESDGGDWYATGQDNADVQPSTRYWVGEDYASMTNKSRSDGDGTTWGALNYATATNSAHLYAGTHLSGAANQITIGVAFLHSAVINGASSSIRVNENAQKTGSAGSADPKGVTIGNNFVQNDAGIYIRFCEFIAYSAAQASTPQATLRANFAAFHGEFQ